MGKDILETIIERKRLTLAAEEEAVPESFLEKELDNYAVGTRFHPFVSMKESLGKSRFGIISEFKRRSPSKDWINREADAAVVTPAYEAAGASALSILTDEPFFGGSMRDVIKARQRVNLPILRKDFIVSSYQLLQAKLIGADAVLLIAACLTKEECKQLAKKAHELGLETLLEVHSERELEYVGDCIDMVGVNNRNLGTFHTDVANSFRLASLLPKDMLLVSESGISKAETVKQLREAGFRGFLIGETFMKTSNPGEALKDFIRQLE